MTELFTQRRRLDVLDRLSTFFSADNSIAGLVLVGSSAEEDVDMYSGLDLLVVVHNGAVFPSVYRKWKTRLHDILPVAFDFETEKTFDHANYSMMLEDYLEINLYFSPLKKLVASRRPWQLIFDATPAQDVLPTLDASYHTESIVGPARRYQFMLTSTWQPVIKCVAAINRNELWRALHMLDHLRHQTIELAALNYDIDTRNYAEVDQLPEMLLIQLRHTVPTTLNKSAIRRALHSTVDIFFAQAEIFEETLQFKMAKVVYDKMKPYIEAFA